MVPYNEVVVREAFNLLGLTFEEDMDTSIDQAMALVVVAVEANHRGNVYDAMTALVNRGPLNAGDIPSKAGLAFATERGLAIDCVAGGVPDMYVLTGYGHKILKLMRLL